MTTTNGNGAPPVGQENINTDIITLSRFFTEEQTKHPHATGDFTYVLSFSPGPLLAILAL